MVSPPIIMSLTLLVPKTTFHTFKENPPEQQQQITETFSDVVAHFSSLGRHSTSNSTLYEKDFYEWTQTTATLLRIGKWDTIDLHAVAEEIESLGKSEQNQLSNRLETILEHLLKLAIAASRFPNDFSRSARGWRGTVKTQRIKTIRLLHANPRLRSTVAKIFNDAYEIARVEAGVALDIDENTMPEKCPWTSEQVLNPDFWPDAIP